MKLAFVCSGRPDGLEYLKNNRTEVASVLTSCGWEVIDAPLSNIGEFNKRLQEYEKGTIDEFVFFYTGHGSVSGRQGILELQLDNEEIGINYVLDITFKYINPKKQAIILDACYSGEFKGIELENNTELLSSSDRRETSFEEDDLEQSIFSYYFIEAIKSSKTSITLNEIAHYIKSQTDKQTPVPLNVGTNPILFSMENTQIVEMINKPFNVPFEGKNEGAIGLEEKLVEVHNSLENTRKTTIGQVASFQGMGGLGKTQLAVEYAHTYRESYDAVVWLTIDQDINEQLIELAEKSKWVNKEVDIAVKLIKAKEGYGSLENALLVYDNVDNIDEIEGLFPNSNSNKILVTSRNPLPKFTSIPLETLSEENAMKLLVSESGREICEEEIVDVKDLTEKLEGLPLALEMAGAYVSYLGCSWSEYWTLFSKKGIDVLDKSEINSYTNHEANISSTLSLSDELLAKTPKLEEILNILAWGASDAIDKKLLSEMLEEDEVELIEPLSIGLKLKFLKKGEDGYTLHRLVRDIWKKQNELEKDFIESVAINLAEYMKEIKDEFLFLRELDRAATQARKWVELVDDLHLKAALINYSVYVDYHKGEQVEALKELDGVIELFAKDEESAIYAELLNSKAVLLGNSGQDKESHILHIKSHDIKSKIYKNIEHLDMAQSLSNLALSYDKFNDKSNAYAYANKALLMRKNIHGEYDVKIAETYRVLSIIKSSSDIGLSKEYALESEKICKKTYQNKDHPTIVLSLHTLTDIYIQLENYEKAYKYAIEALKMTERLYANEENSKFIASLSRMSHVYNYLKSYKISIKYYNQTLYMLDKYTPNDNLGKAIIFSSISIAYYYRKECKKAKKSINKAFEELEKLDYEYHDIQPYLNNKQVIIKLIKKHNKAKPKDKKKGRFCIDMDEK